MEDLIRVLYIENDEVDARNFEREFSKSTLKSKINLVDNIEDGLKLIQNNDFEIIFLDYHLPGENGMALLKTIRNIGIITPVVVITSYADPQVAVEMMQAGASDYIPKSLLNADGIDQCIRNSLRISEVERARRLAETNLKSIEDQLSNIISYSPLVVFSLNQKGKITFIKGKRFNGRTEREQKYIGEDVVKVFGMSEDLQRMLEISKSGKEVTRAVKVGEDVYQITLTPRFNEDGELIEILGVSNDITELAKAEASLKKAKDLAEKASRMKQDFIANMSHEIRTPMNAIVGFTNLLEESDLDATQLDFVKTIKLSGENLLALINDILDFSKIEAGKLTIDKEVFNVMDTLDTVNRVLNGRAKEKGLKLEFDISEKLPQAVLGDPNRLYQILMNLVGNAVKFTDEGRITVSAKEVLISEDEVEIEFNVADTGVGIPQTMIEEIFNSFQQVNSSVTRRHGGTGLGLSIVKQLVELQGGDMSVKSNVNVGSEFSFTIKYGVAKEMISDAKSEIKVSQEVVISGIKGLKILLAEDNRMNQKLVKNILEPIGIKLVMVGDGEEAIAKLNAEPFDLVLMDVQMPKIDGIESTRIIRKSKNENVNNLPIVAMTAHAFKEEVEACLNAGMSAHIAKPINKQALLSIIYDTYYNRSSEAVSVEDVASEEEGVELNIDGLKQMSDGSDDFVIEMLQIFLEDTPDILDGISKGLESKDFDRISKSAHKFRSPLGLLGLSKLQSIAEEMEYLAKKEQDLNKIEKLAIELRKYTDKALEQVNAIIAIK